MEISLRHYQQKGKDQLYKSIADEGHKRVIFWLATGGGKSRTQCNIVGDLIACNAKVVMVMRRRELIKQMSGNLDEWNIEHGIYMAMHPRFKPNRDVQVCSIDTLGAREVYPHEDCKNVVVLIDESHDATPSAKKYRDLFERYKHATIIGFTATPFSNNTLFDDIICPITPMQLMEEGFLTPVKCYVPNIIDVSKVTVKRTGQFDEEELFKACSDSEVVGNIVDDWVRYGQGRRTVLFAVNIEHSKMLCDAFNKRGIPATHCDGGTKSGERDRALRRLKEEEIKILCNVNVFSTGLDLVEIECIIFARPTRSLIYYLQAIGRGLRPAPHINKENCIIIDSAGNTLRFGSPYKSREAIIGKPKPLPKEEIEDLSIRFCKQCGFVFDSKEKKCPDCGFINPIIIREIKTRDGELIEYDLSPEEIDAMNKSLFKKDYFKLEFVAKNRIFKNMSSGDRKDQKVLEWVCSKLVEKFGLKFCEENENLLPKRY